MCLLVSDKTSTSATPTLAKPKEFNMGLEVPTSSPPKSSPTEMTSPNPYIFPDCIQILNFTHKY